MLALWTAPETQSFHRVVGEREEGETNGGKSEEQQFTM